MKLKTIFLSGILGLSFLAAAQAQVYSVNVVGYVNLTVPPGFSIIANQLDAGTNTLTNLLPSPPVNTRVYKFTGTTYSIATFAPDDNNVNSWDVNLALSPGEGAFILNPSSSPVSLTFSGEVKTGNLTNTIPAGYSLVASIVPQSGQLTPTLGYVPTANDRVFRYNNGTQSYDISTYAPDDNNVLSWDIVPTPRVGEGFFISTSTPKTWVRNFTPN